MRDENEDKPNERSARAKGQHTSLRIGKGEKIEGSVGVRD